MPTNQDPWNPEQYERYRAERSLPFDDLLALVRREPRMRVVDLGCGTGELTRRLHDALGARETLGVDNSSNMLERAASFAGGGLRFEQGDIADLRLHGSWDLVFSNAALQWLPDHSSLFGRLAGLLSPGAQLAVQMPANHDHPSHTVAAEVAREPPFSAVLGGKVRESPVLAPERYAELLHRLGLVRQHVRLQVYSHLLEGPEDVVEWVKGTLLTHYQTELGAELYPQYLERFRARLLPLLGDERPYLYTFKRVLLWGQLASA